MSQPCNRNQRHNNGERGHSRRDEIQRTSEQITDQSQRMQRIAQHPANPHTHSWSTLIVPEVNCNHSRTHDRQCCRAPPRQPQEHRFGSEHGPDKQPVRHRTGTDESRHNTRNQKDSAVVLAAGRQTHERCCGRQIDDGKDHILAPQEVLHLECRQHLVQHNRSGQQKARARASAEHPPSQPQQQHKVSGLRDEPHPIERPQGGPTGIGEEEHSQNDLPAPPIRRPENRPK